MLASLEHLKGRCAMAKHAVYRNRPKYSPKSENEVDLPQDAESLIGAEVKKLVEQMKFKPKAKEEDPKLLPDVPNFHGTWLESWMVPLEVYKCGANVSSSWNSQKSNKMFRDLQRAYLPQPPLQVSC